MDQLPERTQPFESHGQPSTQNIAVACQGGGSHAAFTAGVLSKLLGKCLDQYRVVSLSGASGGAVSATAAWYGLVEDDQSPTEILKGLWADIAAVNGWELWLNALALQWDQLSKSFGPAVNHPWSHGSDRTRQQLETVLTENIDFSRFGTLSADASSPMMFVSAVDVRNGEFVVFQDAEITPDTIVASAAVPRLFDAVGIDEEHHWDGFLSKNPPIVDFMTNESLPPIDEGWVIRLSPKAISALPTTGNGISDRKQQLVENLSLTHELRLVRLINRWIEAGKLSSAAFTQTTIRTIELNRDQAEISRLDRSSSFSRRFVRRWRSTGGRFRPATSQEFHPSPH